MLICLILALVVALAANYTWACLESVFSTVRTNVSSRSRTSVGLVEGGKKGLPGYHMRNLSWKVILVASCWSDLFEEGQAACTRTVKRFAAAVATPSEKHAKCCATLITTGTQQDMCWVRHVLLKECWLRCSLLSAPPKNELPLQPGCELKFLEDEMSDLCGPPNWAACTMMWRHNRKFRELLLK